jgi:elongation factor Ts
MMECKNALEEANGDIDMAIEILRKKGIAKSSKRADNATHEGKIKIVTEGNTAYIVSVACESDFVSRNDTFDGMLNQFLGFLKTGTDAEALANAENLKNEYTLKIGENMRILKLTKVTGEVLGSYIHSNSKVAALVIAKAGTDAEKLKQVAMHVVASQPLVVSPSDIDATLVAKEQEIQLELMKNDPKNAGKPTEILEKIIGGKMTKFREENALLTQPFVMNPDEKVQDFIGANAIVSFERFAI